jgi:hypothetical protein
VSSDYTLWMVSALPTYLRPPNHKFYLTLAGYAVLALLAGLTLDGQIRLATWIFLGGLALKTWLVTLQKP